MWLAVVATTSAGLVQAETGEPTGLKNVFLSIYPEYDDPYNLGYPTVLVMIEGEIDGTAPPATVRFLVPTNAVMYSAGSGPRDQYVGGPPARKASEIAGWDEIAYTLQTSYFVVEYYYPIQTLPQKDFTSEFIPLYPVNRLVALVQKPRKATDFSVATGALPMGQQQFTDADGFRIQQYSYNSIEPNESLKFSIRYTKEDTTPSLEIEESSSNNTGVIVGGAIGGCLFLAIVTFFTLRRLRRRKSAALQKARTSGRSDTGEAGGSRFCSQCGTKLKKSSRFCPDCGARLRE